MNIQTKKRLLTISVLIAALAILLAFLAFPRTSTERMALEALPSKSFQQLTDQIAALDGYGTVIVWDNVYIVNRSNLLGWEETIYLLPVASQNVDNVRIGGDRINTASLYLLSTATGIEGKCKQISITLNPGENISVRGNLSFILAVGRSSPSQLVRKSKADRYTFDTPVTALDMSWFAGIQDDNLVSEQTETQARITFQFDLSYAGQTVAEGQSLTVTQSFSLVR